MRGLKLINGVRGNAGVSTLEVAVLCSAVGILLALASFVLSNVVQNEAEDKLRGDVRAINSAIKVYRLFGGALEESASPEGVLDSLKQRSASITPEAMPGLSGKVIEDRLRVEMQTEEEAASSAPRAIWNQKRQRFEVVHGDIRGVKQFIIDADCASLAFVPDNQLGTSKLAQDESWMWETDSTVPKLGKKYGVSKSADSLAQREAVAVAATGSRKRLRVPVFSASGGTYPITDFNLGLQLSNPNSAGISRIYYSVDDGPWIRLNSSSGIRVQPDTKIAAYCKSINDVWADSEQAASRYGATPVTLDPPRVDASSLQFDFDNNRVVRVTLKNTNAAHCSKLEYRVNGSDWRSYEDPIELEGSGFVEEDARIQVRSKAVANFFYDSVVTEARIARPGSSEISPAAGEDLELKLRAAGGMGPGVPAPAKSKNFAAAALGGVL